MNALKTFVIKYSPNYNGEKYGWEEQSTCTVIAWAEMPEPWRGESDGLAIKRIF